MLQSSNDVEFFMIIGFQHQGLKIFFETGNCSKIQPHHAGKLRLILAKLHASHDIKDMNFPGSNLHALSGNRKNFYSVSVNGNWRVIFQFEKGEATLVDYIDYH